MKNFQKINLDNRLFLCAKNVRPGKFVADVGTDHAYLPIWLVLNNLTPYALATDVREGPLLNAQKNIVKFNVENKVSTRISDGLDSVKPDEVDDIVIAGMGGELIVRIISRAGWLKDNSKHLILQPMSAEPELREFLAREGFKINSEQAVVSSGKVYTVMSAVFDASFSNFDRIYPYVGRLRDNLTPEACLYVEKTVRDLKNKLKGYKITRNFEKADELQYIISELEALLGGKIND